MGYFDQVTPPPAINNQPICSSDKYIELISRIEKRAMEVVAPSLQEMTDDIIVDPYGQYSPGDSLLWQELFTMVQQKRELYARLFFIRGGGTKLIRHQQWGFIFQPAIGANGWTNMEEYNCEKQCLNGYRDEIVDGLRDLARTKLTGGI